MNKYLHKGKTLCQLDPFTGLLVDKDGNLVQKFKVKTEAIESDYKNLKNISETLYAEEILIPDISEIIREVTPNISTNVEENSLTSDVHTPCPIIEKHRNTLSSRSDVKKLSDAERDEIIKKYRSVSVFLKKLKSYY